MSTDPQRQPDWLLHRDVDAVAAHLDPWILAADEVPVPALGSPEWVDADPVTRTASVAVYVLACLAEHEPVVIAARLAAEIAAARAVRLAAARQASHAISAGHDWAARALRPSYAQLEEIRAWPIYPRPPAGTRQRPSTAPPAAANQAGTDQDKADQDRESA